MEQVKSRIKRRAAIAVVVAGMLGVGGSTLVGGPTVAPLSHKPGHEQPPGCQKVKQKYGGKPSKRCKNHPPQPPTSSSSSSAKKNGKK